MTFDNKTTALGKILSEKIIAKFAEGKKIKPVERNFIFKLIDEMKLGITGLVEPKTIQQVGKFSGASYVLVGTIQKVGKNILVNSRLVETETSNVEKAVEVTLKSTPDIFELLSQEIKTPLIPTPEETDLPADKAGQMKLMKTDFDKLRKDYTHLQGELDNLMRKSMQAKDENEKRGLRNKKDETQKLLTVSEYNARGNIADGLGNYNPAIVSYTKAIKLNPENAKAYYWRGISKGFNRNIERTLEDLSRAGELGYSDAYEVIRKLQGTIKK